MDNLKRSLEVLQQKAKERTVKTQNIEYDIDTLVKRIDRGAIRLDPDYQRRHRWSDENSSRLIESLILNIPIPVIFISQDVDVDQEVGEDISRYTVVDGQQRLTAIYRFVKGGYSLCGLEALSELNGAYYNDLPPFLFRRLEERTIKCLRIDSTVDAQVKYDIFERLNTGSVKLESQELRNAIARGAFNDEIKLLAENPSFRSLIQVDQNNPEESNKVKKMEDAELVLRYFALRNNGYTRLKKGFKEFLTTSLVELNGLGEQQRGELSEEFLAYIEFIRSNFGSTAFAKYRFDAGQPKKMSNFNAAVYDALLIGVSAVYAVNELNSEAISKISGYTSLFAKDDFFAAVSGSVNDAAKVSHRINSMIGYIRR